MAAGRKIKTGFLRDAASVVKAMRVMESLAEANPGRIFEDFIKSFPERKGRQSKGISGLLSMLSNGDMDILIADAYRIPLNLPAGLELASVSKRGNPFNVLVSREDLILEEQPDDVPIAVPDPASRGQLLYYRPDLLLNEADGGYNHLRELMNSGEIGGFVVDASEVEALGGQEQVVEVFTASICMPAAGQGAAGLIVRRCDRKTRSLVDAVNDGPSQCEIMLERMLLARLSKDGKGPIGALGKVDEDEFQISAVIAAPDGSEKLSGIMQGWIGEEEKVTSELAASLLESGGAALIRNFNR